MKAFLKGIKRKDQTILHVSCCTFVLLECVGVDGKTEVPRQCSRLVFAFYLARRKLNSETGRIRFRRKRFQWVFGPHRVPGRELSEFLSAYYLCAKANSPSSLQNSPSLPKNSVRLSEFSSPKQYSRNSILPVSYFCCLLSWKTNMGNTSRTVLGHHPKIGADWTWMMARRKLTDYRSSQIITGSLVILEKLFPQNYSYRYRLEARMNSFNFHYRYRLGVRSHCFTSIDYQLPSWKSFELMSVKATVTILKCFWIRKVIISNMTVISLLWNSQFGALCSGGPKGGHLKGGHLKMGFRSDICTRHVPKAIPQRKRCLDRESAV